MKSAFGASCSRAEASAAMLPGMSILDDIKPSVKKLRPMEVGVVAGDLAITWDDGWRTLLSLKYMRQQCPCAGCVDEWSGKRTLNPLSIRDDIKPLKMSPVGRYALQLTWNDGHATGIYSWDLLHKLILAQPKDAA